MLNVTDKNILPVFSTDVLSFGPSKAKTIELQVLMNCSQSNVAILGNKSLEVERHYKMCNKTENEEQLML